MIMTKELLDEIELISDAFCDEQYINKYRADYIARLQEIIDLCCKEAVDAISKPSIYPAPSSSDWIDKNDAIQAIEKRLKGD
ncbi:MAG: hypothetical protein DRN30_06930 [Thermoplasmata archaeon]|nr:MAG: hypothetical protein DRN30_06930 [Thermoplasmata archaeon]